MTRLTWLQPEDLITHEFRQAEEEGRDVTSVRARWLAAGGSPTPPRSGTSPRPAAPQLTALAEQLLTELDEPTEPVRRLRTRPFRPMAGVRGRQPLPAAEPLIDAAGRGGTGESPAGPTHRTRLHAAWLGRSAGCLLGKPVEKLPLKAIRALAKSTGNWPLNTWFTARGVPPELTTTYPWNRRSAPTSLAENINGMPEDDDLNYPLLNLLLLQRHGKAFTTQDVATLWLEELPAARTFTAERVAYRNLLNGIDPPRTARHHNPFREWIGALIRADVHGWTNPDGPTAAAEQAYRDACLTHTGNGVYGAMFAAATIARAASGTADVHQSLAAGLAVVPADSRLAKAVRHGIQLAHGHGDFDDVADRLHEAYGTHHWVHVVPNAALLAAALTHADGDFTASITRAVSGGWDTDSNGATAGSIAGLLAGHPDALPARWTAPLKNRLATSVGAFHGTGFDTLAALTARLTAPQTAAPASQTTDPTPQEAPRP
ncbi:ADP-ribosylglycohydrolase family protein [Streptomyces aureoverticillatus]|uniref:ADP-ribosylglycohydrolase family protein n=1 Tax=Streptomyces aureoverticillatus TaxID=66871 RepID=UPI0013DD3829|nr:ADP-ribosylglycohydrolase family protein [Streptomyces aureoverticillatus]QIB46338.1 ADP-ribosylglycohydrolase family protein [Streptomyces aureoverticillatus]